MKALITGVSSSIGIAVSNRLLEAGHQVVGIDIRTPASSPNGLEFVAANVRDIDALMIAAGGCDTGIHLAVNADASRPTQIFDTNTAGAYNFLRVAQDIGFRNAIIASSAPVHLSAAGAATDTTLATSTTEDHPYDLSKLLQEAIARDFHSHGVPVMCLRFGHVVLGAQGVNLDDKTPLAELTYCRGGWVSLEDVASACALALDVSPSAETLEILNVIGAKAARRQFSTAAVEQRLNFTFAHDFAAYE